MLFRIIDDKLYHVDIDVQDEEKFVEENSSINIKYISVDISSLPIYDGREDIKYFYKLDSDGNIIIDDERTLNNYKNEIIDIVNKMRDDLLLEGFDWTQPSTNSIYHFPLTEDYKFTLLQLAVAALLGQTDNLFIIDADNNTISLTQDDAKNLALYAANIAGGIYYKARTIKDAINNCSDIACVDQIIEENLNG